MKKSPNTGGICGAPNPVKDAFELATGPTLTTRTLHKSNMTVTELRSDSSNFGLTKSTTYDEAYLIGLQLRACPDHDLYFDGRLVVPKNFVAGATTIYDLRHDPVADLRSPFHSLFFYLPHKVLDAIAYDEGGPRISGLQYQTGVGIDDHVVRNLLLSLIPSLSRPREANALFVDHVALALSGHIAQAYGNRRGGQVTARGGLSPSQERRTKEMLMANINGEISICRLAAECGLTERHFTRAFKQSTGVPPHRWLSKMRIEQAKRLLINSSLTLADISLTCGFADQSHFTRAFAKAIGVPPGTWRRMQI
jgi:AraC-like DNA-binding protein